MSLTDRSVLPIHTEPFSLFFLVLFQTLVNVQESVFLFSPPSNVPPRIQTTILPRWRRGSARGGRVETEPGCGVFRGGCLHKPTDGLGKEEKSLHGLDIVVAGKKEVEAVVAAAVAAAAAAAAEREEEKEAQLPPPPFSRYCANAVEGIIFSDWMEARER